MTVCYLDLDDEITNAVSRMRAADGPLLTLVLPTGSRISTSRINFLILAREARAHGRKLGIVSGEAGVRALAVSAGLTAHSTVEESEAALGAAGPEPAERGATWRDQPWRDLGGHERQAAPATVVPVSDSRTVVPVSESPTVAVSDVRTVAPYSAAIDAGSTAAGSQTSARARAVEDRAHSRAAARRRVSLFARVAMVLAVLAVLAGGAYLYLPTAEITLTPRTETAGPVTLEVVADPAVRVVDTAGARIPADVPTVPLSVSAEFPATGVKVSQTRATGVIRFTSENTLFDVPIPAGTRVSTADKVAFTTLREVIIPKASFATGPTTTDVDVQAVPVGADGNVAAGAITRVPASLTQSLVSATNPEATTGGRRSESREVQKRDYDTAVRQLTARLEEELRTLLQDPATTPKGLTVYPETATVEDVRPDQAAGDLVGTRQTSFTLTLSATGKVLAVDRSILMELATDRLTASVPQGFHMLDGTAETVIGEPEVVDGTIRYTMAAQALQWRPVEPSTIISAIRGRRIQEAKTTLEQYGSADVRHWPEFLDTIPTQDFRITVQVHSPGAP